MPVWRVKIQQKWSAEPAGEQQAFTAHLEGANRLPEMPPFFVSAG